MCVPAEWVKKMDCGIDGLFNIYLSMGANMKEFLGAGDDAPGEEKTHQDQA